MPQQKFILESIKTATTHVPITKSFLLKDFKAQHINQTYTESKGKNHLKKKGIKKQVEKERNKKQSEVEQ